MSEENEHVANRFHMDIFQEGKLDVADEIVTDDFHWHGGFAPPERGPGGVKEVATSVIGAFPDCKITHHDTIAQGDKVLIRWSMTGTQEGELMGIPATGKSVTITGFDYFRLADGKIAEMWQEADQLGMMQQLGVLPAPAAVA